MQGRRSVHSVHRASLSHSLHSLSLYLCLRQSDRSRPSDRSLAEWSGAVLVRPTHWCSASSSSTGLTTSDSVMLPARCCCSWYCWTHVTGAVVGSSTLHSQAASVGRTDAKRYFYSVPPIGRARILDLSAHVHLYTSPCLCQASLGRGISPQNLQPPQTACRSCALNLFLGRDSEYTNISRILYFSGQ